MNCYIMANKYLDSPQAFSFGQDSPKSTFHNERNVSPRGIRPYTPDGGDKRFSVSIRLSNNHSNAEQPDSLNLTRNSEEASLSERESIIKEKLRRVVLNTQPVFKDKQIEKYLRYEHTFYQILRVFKGALKRELYYSFENLKNWGNFDPRVYRSFVKVLNRLSGRTQQALYQSLIMWRDNAKRKQLAITTLRNFALILNLRKNMALEKGFMQLQLALWLNASALRSPSSSRSSTHSFKFGRTLKSLLQSEEIPPMKKAASSILFRALKNKTRESLAHSFRKLRHWNDGILKRELELLQGTEKLQRVLIGQGGAEFFSNLREFWKQFSPTQKARREAEERISEENSNSKRKSKTEDAYYHARRSIEQSPNRRIAEFSDYSSVQPTDVNAMYESQSFIVYEPSPNTIQEEDEEDSNLERSSRQGEDRGEYNEKQQQSLKQGLTVENASSGSAGSHEESLARRNLEMSRATRHNESEYYHRQKSYDASLGTMIVNQTNPDETIHGYQRFDINTRPFDSYSKKGSASEQDYHSDSLQTTGFSHGHPAVNRKHQSGEDNAELEDRIRNVESFSSPKLNMKDPTTSKSESQKISAKAEKVSHSSGGKASALSEQQKLLNRKVAVRLLPKLLVVAVPRLQKAMFFYKLKLLNEIPNKRALSPSPEKLKPSTMKHSAALFIMKTLDLIFKYKIKINLSAAFHDIMHFSQESSLNALRQNFSSRIIDAKKHQSYDTLAKILDAVFKSSRYRSLSQAVSSLKTSYQEALFSKNMKTIKLKNIVKKNMLMNLACAFK